MVMFHCQPVQLPLGTFIVSPAANSICVVSLFPPFSPSIQACSFSFSDLLLAKLQFGKRLQFIHLTTCFDNLFPVHMVVFQLPHWIPGIETVIIIEPFFKKDDGNSEEQEPTQFVLLCLFSTFFSLDDFNQSLLIRKPGN